MNGLVAIDMQAFLRQCKKLVIADVVLVVRPKVPREFLRRLKQGSYVVVLHGSVTNAHDMLVRYIDMTPAGDGDLTFKTAVIIKNKYA
jgi:hypothetical protein